ncbi:hypothetical protein [Mycobacteroides saopaulense]|uniref:hypothetical protein n=1 Tax=Mycobacteroides saopaulense TaxID=1578165 RepID=UPI0010554312|nr:hypothetical protein [Mycobacteroides saopaulense]
MVNKVMKPSLAMLVLSTALIACGSPTTSPSTRAVSEQEAKEVLENLAVSIPDSYRLIKMEGTWPPGPGSPSYVGAFEGDNSGSHVLINNRPLDAKPTTCNGIANYLVEEWKKIGFTCDLAQMSISTVQPSSAKTTSLSLLTGTATSNKAQLYIFSAGT